MRVLKVLSVAFFLFTFAACNDSSSGSGGSGGGGGNGKLHKPSFPNEMNSIYGSWQMNEQQHDNGITFIYQIYFNRSNEVGFSLLCELIDGTVLNAVATIPAAISNRQVEFLQGASVIARGKDRNGRDASCTLSLKARSMFSYEVSGDDLVITSGNESKSLTRLQE